MPTYDFSRLSSFDFEELVADLLRAEWNVDLEVFTPGRDSGIDLRAFADTQKETIVQCKHMPNTSFSKLLSHLRKVEHPKVRALAPKRYVFVTSLGLTPENTKALVQLFKPFLRRQSDVYGRSRINGLLRRHKDVETNNFKLWLTSTAVLQRVLHNAEHSRTQFEIDRVTRKVPLFVQNDAFPRAQKILEDSRVVVISGEPGIGKTTLAEMLLFAHLEQGFAPVVVEGGIEEAKRLFDRNQKQLFYFDDFLGETFLQERPELLAKNQDAALIHFIDAIRSSHASRFILTTREHILRKALSTSEKLRGGSLLDHRCILELHDYSFGQKARILYNHLYFSDLPTEYKAAIIAHEFYFRIIRHRNFNPRLIEWLSGFNRVKTVPASEYQDHVTKLLDSPEEIWSHAFEQQISEAARNILFTLAVVLWNPEVELLESAWRALHQLKSRKYNFSTTALDFRRALNDLEGSFVKIAEQRVAFLNPSIRDFMEGLYRSNGEFALDTIEAAVHFGQIRRLHDFNDAEPSDALSAILALTPQVIDGLKRTLSQTHVRWRIEPDGRYLGTHIDDAPDSRLRTIIEWAEEQKSNDLLEVVALAYEYAEKYWQQLLVFIPGLLNAVKTLEDSPWVRAHGGETLRRKMLDKMFENLPRARAYDWRTVLNYRADSKQWSSDDETQFTLDFQEYRRRGVYAEVEECEELSDLESMRDGLQDIQKSHRQVFKRVIKKIRVAIEELKKDLSDDSDEDDDYQPVSKGKTIEPENEDDVRRLFGSLV
ncbi:hypothetical protein ACVIGA_002290 [Bradyrhizobium sp. USDA 3240]